MTAPRVRARHCACRSDDISWLHVSSLHSRAIVARMSQSGGSTDTAAGGWVVSVVVAAAVVSGGAMEEEEEEEEFVCVVPLQWWRSCFLRFRLPAGTVQSSAPSGHSGFHPF